MTASVFHYRLYDLLLESEESLCLNSWEALGDEGGPSERGEPRWRFQLGDLSPPEGICLHDVIDFDGRHRLKIHRTEEGDLYISYGEILLKWSARERRILLREGRTPERTPEMKPGVILERLAAPIAFLLERPSTVALHASAVRAPDGRAWIFIGESGTGKSTTALEFMRRGMELLADDLVIIEGATPRLIAATPTLRLFDPPEAIPEAVDEELVIPEVEKYWYQLPERKSGEVYYPIAGIFSLEPEKDSLSSELQRLSGTASIQRILAQAFDFSDGPAEYRARRFQALCALARTIPVYRVRYSRNNRSAPGQVDAILKGRSGADG